MNTELILTNFQRKINRQARSIPTNSLFDACDYAQEIYIRIMEICQRSSVDETNEYAFVSFVNVCIANVVSDIKRKETKKSRINPTYLEAMEEIPSYDGVDLAIDLEKIVDKLTPTQQLILEYLKHHHTVTYMMKELGRSRTFVNKHIRIVKSELEKLW